jgi:mannitol/fructose-specific phosphotransferase system IIA component (Ntr-type)
MTIGQFTEPKLLIPCLLSDRQDGAIQELTKRLEATGRIENSPGFLEAVLKRETEMPTFIEGVAVPHVRGGAVQKLSVAVGLSATGIPWGLDKRRVAHAVFLFAVPLTEAQTYLSLLSGLSSLIQDEVSFTALKRATQPEEMQSVLNTLRLVRRTVHPSQPMRR